MQHKVCRWKDIAVFCVTSTLSTMSPVDLSACKLSKKRAALVSPLKLTEHTTWCQQMARGRKLSSQPPAQQRALVPLLISSDTRRLLCYSQPASPSAAGISGKCWLCRMWQQSPVFIHHSDKKKHPNPAKSCKHIWSMWGKCIMVWRNQGWTFLAIIPRGMFGTKTTQHINITINTIPTVKHAFTCFRVIFLHLELGL